MRVESRGSTLMAPGFWRWFAALWTIAALFALVSCQPMSIRPAISVGDAMSGFVDVTGTLTIEEIVGFAPDQFRRDAAAARPRLAAGGPQRLWLSLTLPDDVSTRPGWTPPFIISIREPRLERADLFVAGSGGIRQTTWDPRDGRPYSTESFRYPSFILEPEQIAGAKLFLRLERLPALQSEVWFSDFQSFYAAYDASTTRLSVLIGVMGAMLIYIFALGASLRNQTNLWLAACTASSLAYFVSSNALLQNLVLPGLAMRAREVALISVLLIFCSFVGFVTSFLGLKRVAPRISRIADGLTVFLAAAAVLAILDLSLGVGIARSIAPYLGFAVIVFTLIALMVAGRRQPARSLTFMLAWAPSLVAGGFRLLADIQPQMGAGPIENGLLIAMVASLVAFTGAASLDIQKRETRLRSEILHNADRFRAFAEIGTDLFWEMDRDGAISFVTGRQVGRTHLALGEKLFDRLAVTTSAEMLKPLRELIESGLPCDSRRLRIEDGDGDLWISISGRAIPPPKPGVVFRGVGRSVYRGLIRDVTEEVERENRRQLEQQMFALGQLAGSVAHEINNLIHPIINLTKRLRLHLRDTIDPASSRMMELIDISSKQAATVVSELLQSTRGERWKDTSRPISLAVEHSVEAIRPALPSSMRIDCIVENCESVTVKIGDILQIVGNLLSNAVHAVQGAGTVVVTLAVAEGGAKLVVADNGAGMEESVRLKAMQPFFSTKIDGEGTGVGLYIVQRIVRDYDGFISIESSPGNGTAVTIFFPQRKDDNE
ncbi:hypothetical protein Sa4125_09670 [Aureimonas sp. SA4125]|uniref:sensor histidine kinase n=1 Tax=Aureimonas sp. SA4125 TaxID=2826993 RepID=UPI001CC6F9F9|nr:ATP-binding protein [Aureimonas sp. SA4125]BDA83425.1 hypothetical protein Sa4125_09670 [Aureimonas sp. SA4125]